MRLNGMHLQENSALTDTILIRMCRSKRKRIVKKWLKNKRNYKTVPSQKVFIFGDPVRGKVIVCHPVIAARIKEALRIRGRMKYNTVDNQPGVTGYLKQRIGLIGGPLKNKYMISEQLKDFT